MQETELDLRAILGLLRRQAGLIVSTLILTLAVAGVALMALKPVYKATALVYVDPNRKNLLDPDTAGAGSASDNARVESEVRLVKTPSNLMSVVQAADLIQNEEYRPRLGMHERLLAFLHLAEPQPPSGEEALRDIVRKLEDAIGVRRQGLTFLIEIAAGSHDPETAARIANALADAYIRGQLDSKINSTLAARDVIDMRVDEARRNLVAAEEAFDNYLAGNIETIAMRMGRPDVQAFYEQLTAGAAREEDLRGLAGRIQANLAANDWGSVRAALQADIDADLRRREELDLQLASGPELQAPDLRAELEEIEARLTRQVSDSIAALNSQAEAARAQNSDLRQRLRTTILESELPADILAALYEIQQTTSIARRQYQDLLTRAKELETQAFLQVADSRLAEPATPPQEPAFPNNRLAMGLAGVLGLGLGVGFAFLREYLVGGFITPEQVETVLGARVTAVVPVQKPNGKSEEDGGSVADTVVHGPLSAYAEAIRRLRAGIDRCTLQKEESAGPGKTTSGTVIMITSALPNEGKTTTALALARVYAAAGRSTLLVDCDLRKPSLHRQIDHEPSAGLLEHLSGANVPLKEIAVRDPLGGAHLMLGARRSSTATDQFFTGQSFARLVHGARSTFDVIILDTPPIGPVVDGLYLAPQADIIVMLVKWAATSQGEARAALSSLNGAADPRAAVMTVLNQEARPKKGYDAKYSSYYADA